MCPLYSINGKFKVIDSVKEIETLAFYGQNDINEIELSKNIEILASDFLLRCSKITKYRNTKFHKTN